MKNRNLFFYSTLLSIFFFTSIMKAQIVNAPNSSTAIKKVKSDKWQLLFSNETVEVSYKYGECKLPSENSHNEYVYLQIKNKTNQMIICDWSAENWYSGICNGCTLGNTENYRSVVLKPNETLEGNCSKECNKSLMIFSEMLNYEIKSKLTNFNVTDFYAKPVSK